MERSVGQGVEVSCFKLLRSGKDWPLDSGSGRKATLEFSRGEGPDFWSC